MFPAAEGQHATVQSDTGEQNDEFCIKNGELCIKNEELCVKNAELCIKMMNFAGAYVVDARGRGHSAEVPVYQPQSDQGYCERGPQATPL